MSRIYRLSPIEDGLVQYPIWSRFVLPEQETRIERHDDCTKAPFNGSMD
ncbi:MAG: hypothetical protein ABI988_07895 [Nitrospirota bacterium]